MGRIAAIKTMLKEKRFGFVMDETMTGSHEFEPRFGAPGRRFMEFKVTWGPKNVRHWGNPFSTGLINDLEGTVTIEGLCTDTPCTGSLELRYLKDASIRYTFDFTADGVDYHYVGEKLNIKPWNLPYSHTTCFGRLTRLDTGELVSTSLTHFRFRTSLAFAASFRPA